MQKFAKEVATHWDLEMIYSGVGSPARSRSKSHGGFDNDVDTMNDILRNILAGRPAIREFTGRDLNY